MRSVQQVEDDDISVVLSIGLRSQQDDTGNINQAKHELTNDMMKERKGEEL